MAENYVQIKIKASDTAKPDITELKAQLDELGHKVETAKVKVDDAAGSEKLLRLNAKLAELNQKVANPKIKVAGAARAAADIMYVEHELDKLDKKGDSAGPNGVLGKILGGASGASGKGSVLLGSLLALQPVLTSLTGAAVAVGAGLAGAFVTGGIAAAAFGEVAKSVLTQASGAASKVQAAQDAYTAAVAHGTKQAAAYKTEQIAIAKAYAEMSPAQIKLSKEIGSMGDQWAKVKQSLTPMISGALQPWIRSITDAMGSLKPIIETISPIIADLGRQFDSLVRSNAFSAFRDFVASFGSWSVSAIGGALLDSLKAFMILLPKFAPLIGKAVEGIQKLGAAFLNWAGSGKATNEITKFMDWFAKNGPAVGGLLKNVGAALKALAPGLGAASTSELNALSGFFGLIAKLPPSVAKPLTEIAGAMMLLNKFGVVKVGIKLLGPQGAAAEGEAAAGGSAGLWAKLLPGVRMVGGALVVAVVVDAVLKGTSSGKGKNWLDNPFGQGTYKDPTTGKQAGNATALTSWKTLGHDMEHDWDMVWQNIVGRAGRGVRDAALYFDQMRHEIASKFDGIRHSVATAFDGLGHGAASAFDGVRHAAATAGHDIASAFDNVRHDIASKFDNVRHDIASKFDGAVGWLKSTGSDIIHGLEGGVKSAWTAVSSWFSGLPGKIKGFLSGAASWLLSAGKAIIQGLIDGINSMISGLSGVIGHVVSIVKSVASALGIHSPSTVMRGYGVNIMQGLMAGMASQMPSLRSQMGDISGTISGTQFGVHGGLGGGQLQLKVAPGGGSAFEQFMVMALRNYVRVRGGNVQSVIGH